MNGHLGSLTFFRARFRQGALFSKISSPMGARFRPIQVIAMPRSRQGMCLLAMITVHSGMSSPVNLGKTAQGHKSQYPPLDLVKTNLQTTASRDFADHHEAFVAAHEWQRAKLLNNDKPAPYLACAEYGSGHTARESLESAFPASGTYTVSHTKEYGACFIVSASFAEAEDLMENPSAFGLSSAGPLPSVLKLSPSLLDFAPPKPTVHLESPPPRSPLDGKEIDSSAWEGLSVRLSPGVMKVRDASSMTLVNDWKTGFTSEGTVDTARSSNFWADPDMLEADNGHLSRPEGEALAHKWTKAADVLEGMLGDEGDTIGEACGWHKVRVHAADDDLVLVHGMDHLLAEKSSEEEMGSACYMYFLSHLASKPEVMRVSPLASIDLSNDVSSAIIQSASIEDTPLFDEGLDGTDQVIQIIDTGLDETSCFFVDDDGLEIPHGSYFDGFRYSGDWILEYSPESSYYYDLSRRKVVQYIDLFKRMDPDVDQINGDGYYYFTERYGTGEGDWHDNDEEDGHGTHTAGIAAGARIRDYVQPECPAGYQDGCVGECITPAEADAATSNNFLDIDTYCPSYSCDGSDPSSPNCLSDDPIANLDDNAGVAPGAKLSIFDISHNDTLRTTSAGNGLWDVSMSTGAKIHSNSWGFRLSWCILTDSDTLYDQFMYENPEHLLIFAAGNDGAYEDFIITPCTTSGPGLGKSPLSIGATSSGPTRVPITGTDGRARYEEWGLDPADGLYYELGYPSTSSEGAGIDTVAYFSSFGPTFDGRIKPELVAPGDRVFSASSDGTDYGSCELLANPGTSMAAPAVAGAAALVRQYFMDSDFYVKDLESRGLCFDGTSFKCETFSPSAATVKAMLINSANLMGGSTQPDGYRGFGRVHLEAGMPFRGEGKKILYVTDSYSTYIFAGQTPRVYTFDVDESAGEDIRVTLCWIDPPSESLSTSLLINDLDLKLTGPDGTVYYMWGDVPDTVNVNERVIIPAAEVVGGSWKAEVSADQLVTNSQAFSLVISVALA